MSKQNIPLDAIKLRLILLIGILVLFALSIFLGITGINMLRSYAADVRTTIVEANESDRSTEQAKQKIAAYAQNQEVSELAQQIVAERESYRYQNVAFTDLNAMAKRAGLTIKRYTFSDTPDPSATRGRAQATPATPQGALKPTYIIITIDSPVDYRRFLNFLNYIEQNLTKMQINNVSLTRAQDDDSDNSVLSQSLTVEVYTR